MKLDRRLGLFVTLVGISLTCLITANLTGGKLTNIIDDDWAFSVGQLAFPLTFVLTDIFNEFYGRQTARQVTYLMAAMSVLAFVLINLADAMPFASFTTSADWKGINPDAFERVFTSATRIQIASFIAFLLASLIDISVFFVIKRATGNRFLWLRATGSTVISQGIDTVLITWLAFGNLWSASQIWRAILIGYVIKLVWAVAMTPVIYGVHELLEKVFGIEPIRAEHGKGEVGSIKDTGEL